MIEVDVRKRLRDYPLDVRFSVPDRRCLALVGPTGCGKTTTLRLIAGLERPDDGSVRCDGEPLVDTEGGVFVPPQRRNVGVVFQDYALFPHLTVLGNASYGARARGLSRADAEEKAHESLRLVRMDEHAHIRATELSGGQRQRVALARALACEPRALLMDEPLSALDAGTRREVREQLRDLLDAIGLQTILVTHDVADALTLGDTVCVMERGRIEEWSDRAELLARPRTAFVAEFLGMNLLEGEAEAVEGEAPDARRFHVGGRTVLARGEAVGAALLALAPWDVHLTRDEPEADGRNVLRGTVRGLSHLGPRMRVVVEDGLTVVCEVDSLAGERLALRTGDEVWVAFAREAARTYR